MRRWFCSLQRRRIITFEEEACNRVHIMSAQEDEGEIDAFLDSDETIEELLKQEYDESDFFDSRDEIIGQFEKLDDDEIEIEEPTLGADEELIKGTGIAFADMDTDDVEIDEHLSPDEMIKARHNLDEEGSDPISNAVAKATESERMDRVRGTMEKRELLDLAADMVAEFFEKNVQEDGLDEEELSKIRFTARRKAAKILDI